MAYTRRITREYGHPWTRESGWDLMEVRADNDRELSAFLDAARSKFWKVWIRDQSRRMAVLYKPSRARADWDDRPGATSAARILAEARMQATSSRLEVVALALQHHVRAAADLATLKLRAAALCRSYCEAVVDPSEGASAVEGCATLCGFLYSLQAVENGADWRDDASTAVAQLMDGACATPADCGGNSAAIAAPNPPVRAASRTRRPGR